ncbi:MAG: prephenate dehydrogenase [Firmicutes bacterium]|nr:prephenate dehydrogenase [Bacillota bacterium]
MRTRRVGVVGLGLIGGSLGLAFTGRGRFKAVIGYDPAPGVGEAALAAGAITEVAPTLAEVAVAETIVVATPVRAVVPTILALLPHLRPGTILTDVASTKTEIVAGVTPYLPSEIFFVGGHPFAGSERAGLGAADAYLFENAAYVLTTEPAAPAWVYEELREILSCTGARFLHLSPHEHDLIAAGVSHLPHLVAAALVTTAGTLEKGHPAALTLAGGGFRATTRIAGGEPGLWAEILSTNRDPLLEVLDLFRTAMDRFAEALRNGDETTLSSLLASARRIREEIPARGKGLLGKVEELVVAIQDRPGAIKEVLDVLAAAGINIKDIEILRLREGEGGTLRLAVEDEPTLVRAIDLLRLAGFSARRR